MLTFNVPFLSEPMIEAQAEKLIHAYAARFPCTMPPVPVDEIAEVHLGLDLRLDDVTKLGLEAGVLGATWVDTKEVVIDSTLDPHQFPKMLGRYRFTVGHEIGHWILHAALQRAATSQGDLFTKQKAPPIICRAPIGMKPREEWQADTFGGNLLMPKRLIVPAWRKLYGDVPYHVVEQGFDLRGEWSLGGQEMATGQEAKQLAAIFQVSVQAMQIRLSRLGLLRKDDGQMQM